MKRVMLIEETQRKGLTFTNLADQIGVTKATISMIVNCRSNPGWDLQQRLVKFFGIPAEELLAVSDEKKAG